ncbi:MAG: hypothetical protein DHS20C21_10380 [Gemmatimonadota bacterium]|nr:MAG: hypothetical protein DHS20C21_10380 [Gemmatimonadota bacterium]
MNGDALPLGDETTSVLLDRAKGGDERALNLLCERMVPRLRRWATGRLPAGARSLNDTEDLVQDAVIRSIRRLEEFRPEGSGAFFGYLRQAVMNRIRDQVRRAGVGDRVMDAAEKPATPFASPLDDVVGRETLERYEAALERLRESDREAIIARIEWNCEYDEIADLVGSASAHAARMKVKRALVRLAKEMGHES